MITDLAYNVASESISLIRMDSQCIFASFGIYNQSMIKTFSNHTSRVDRHPRCSIRDPLSTAQTSPVFPSTDNPRGETGFDDLNEKISHIFNPLLLRGGIHASDSTPGLAPFIIVTSHNCNITLVASCGCSRDRPQDQPSSGDYSGTISSYVQQPQFLITTMCMWREAQYLGSLRMCLKFIMLSQVVWYWFDHSLTHMFR